MNIGKIILFIVIAVNMFACGGGGGSDSSKNLFSLWHDSSDDTPLDLTGGSFGIGMPFYIFAIDGSQCNCDLSLIGTQSSGSYVLNSCYYVYGSSSGDPGCNSINQTGSYTNSSGTLTICDNTNDCTSYH